MSEQMKAIVVDGGVVSVGDLDVPEPTAGQALVRITSAGVCHSDLHLAKGDWMGVTTPQLGHEAIGVVEALGEGAEADVSVGQRVILGLGGAGGAFWCGACEYCLGGRPRHCTQGGTVMGTFAEHFAIWSKALVVLPDSIGDEEAPLACGGLTAYSAVRKLQLHGIPPGRTIGVIGAAGGLGHYAVQILQAFGYKVLGVDVGEERLEFVRSLGADEAVGAEDAAGVAMMKGGIDAVLVFAARVAGFQLGLSMLRQQGLFVGVGLPPTSDGNFEISPFEFFWRDPTLIFSAVGTVQEMRDLIALAADGKVKTHVSRTGSLSEVPQIFSELEAGAYLGRAVLTDLSS
ncbi:MAG: alcohol dehydrogenase catalytic domain-containing protein [Acidimicrobiales bacterium]|nr:alcohol dehydrogenase catalytic domain-containing protein [Acidimicrobiales bacterium]